LQAWGSHDSLWVTLRMISRDSRFIVQQQTLAMLCQIIAGLISLLSMPADYSTWTAVSSANKDVFLTKYGALSPVIRRTQKMINEYHTGFVFAAIEHSGQTISFTW